MAGNERGNIPEESGSDQSGSLTTSSNSMANIENMAYNLNLLMNLEDHKIRYKGTGARKKREAYQ